MKVTAHSIPQCIGQVLDVDQPAVSHSLFRFKVGLANLERVAFGASLEVEGLECI